MRHMRSAVPLPVTPLSPMLHYSLKTRSHGRCEDAAVSSKSVLLNSHKDSAAVHQDSQCPVCLQIPSFPVNTNCGHLFCAPCLITYWRHGSWLNAISCPLCRQKVSVLCHLFSDSRLDHKSTEVLGEITSYNRRYSGAPKTISEYLGDAPLMLLLAARSLRTMGGLLGLFFFRVALCCVGTLVSNFSPLKRVPSTGSVPDPSLRGLLGVLDDLVVVFLLLICVINVNQQMAPQDEQAVTARTAAELTIEPGFI